MADDTTNVVVKFGATIDDLKSKIDEIGGLFETLTKRFAVLAAVVGGGTAFKKFIDEANKVNAETVKLSKTLGIVGDDAAALNTALGDIGSDADAYTGAFLKFNRQLKNNSEGLKELGVDVEGVKNGTISGQQAFSQAVGIVGKYKAGIDQTQVSMQLFGRSVGDVQTLMKLTPAIIEEARKKNEELNLNISQESVDAAKKYKLAVHDVGDVLTGLEKTIGEGVIPIFTESAKKLAAWGPTLVTGMKAAVEVFVDIVGTIQEIVSDVFGVVMDVLGSFKDLWVELFGNDGPGAMTIFKNALALVHIAFIAFRVGFEEVVNIVKTGLQLLGNGFVSYAAIAVKALHLDFAGAQAEYRNFVAERTRITEEGIARAIKIATKGAADIEAAAMKPVTGSEKPRTEYVPPGGDDKAKIKDKNASAMAAARNALLKAQEEAELALQKEYLKEAQSIYDDAYQNGLISTKEYYAAKLEIAQKGIDSELATKRKELEDTKKLENGKDVKPEQRLKFQAQEAQIQGAINVLIAQRADLTRSNADAEQKAMRELTDAQAKFASEQTKASGEGRVADEREQLAQMKALRQISAQDAFAIESKLENESYAITRQSLADKGALIRGTETEQLKQREALQLEGEAAERAHQQKLTQIANQAEQERSKYSTQVQSQSQQAFATMVSSILSGTQKMSDVFRQFAINVSNIFTNMIGQKFAEKIFDATGVNKMIDSAVGFVTKGIDSMVSAFVSGETMKSAAAQAGALLRQGLSSAEALFGIGQKATETTAAVTAEGTETAAAVTADTTKGTSAATAAATAITAQQTESVAAIMGYAAEAAVASMASVAAIPVVGWAMAPEVGAATYATGLAYLASAAGGWGEVPDDQIAQVHKKEMILPAHLAEGIRDMINGTAKKSDLPTALPSSASKASQASAKATPSDQQVAQAQTTLGGKSGDVHFTVSAIDAAGVKKFLTDHGRAIASSLQNQGRNFVGAKAT